MKHENIFSILGAAIISGAMMIGCNSNDTNDSGTVKDTATTMMSTDTTKMSLDTSAAHTDNMMPDNKTGMAKPNPSKKGMKGKVSVSESAAAKSTGSMEADNTGVYGNVEVLPSFPGGYKGLQKYFDDNLQYPDEATSEGVEGTVNVSFVVDEKGKLTSPQIIGDKLGYGLETEALRVVNKMPSWNPGKLKGNNVKTRFTLPVKFVLY